MAVQDFISGLEALGYEVHLLAENRIYIDYVVPVGKFIGQAVKLGFEVPGDWNLTPPGGPHISPRILPLNPNAPDHPSRTAESPNFGSDWEYWSRPCNYWSKTGKTVKDYMRHIKDLFSTQ